MGKILGGWHENRFFFFSGFIRVIRFTVYSVIGSILINCNISFFADRKSVTAGDRNDMLDVKSVRNMLDELIDRTKDFESLDAFRLFVLRHNTYDVDKATKLIKRGKRGGPPFRIIRFVR